MKYLLVFLVFLSFQVIAESAPVIDPITKKLDSQFKKANKVCQVKGQSLWQRRACSGPKRTKFVNTGNWRGTPEYREKYYGKLEVEALKTKFLELGLSRGTYRRTMFPLPGEVTSEIVHREMEFIEARLNKLWRIDKKNAFNLTRLLKKELLYKLDRQ